MPLVLTGADDSTHYSLDGEVKLWDIRGGDNPAQTWDMFPSGLSAFDVHEQTEVFAAYVMIRAPLSSILYSLALLPLGGYDRRSHEARP